MQEKRVTHPKQGEALPHLATSCVKTIESPLALSTSSSAQSDREVDEWYWIFLQAARCTGPRRSTPTTETREMFVLRRTGFQCNVLVLECDDIITGSANPWMSPGSTPRKSALTPEFRTDFALPHCHSHTLLPFPPTITPGGDATYCVPSTGTRSSLFRTFHRSVFNTLFCFLPAPRIYGKYP